MTTIYFVRHAESDYRVHDDATRPLTQKGRQDSLLVTDYLMDKSITRLFSSPYQRASETIHDLSINLRLDITLVEDFRERRVDSGWIKDFASFSRKQWEDFDFKLSDGECLREVQQRNVAALEKLVSTYSNQNLAVASHGTALSTLIHYYDAAFCFADFDRIKSLMPWIVKFTFENRKFVSWESIDLFQLEKQLS